MKFGIVVFPGSNCDHDCYYVSKKVLNLGSEFIWHKETDLKDSDCIIIPGGFSYGDYLRCGAIAKDAPVMRKVKEFASNGGLVIGICNGFQILLEAKMLPGVMLKNKKLKFICEYVHIRLENNSLPFTMLGIEGNAYKIPIAHMEGNYYVDPKTLEELEANKQVIFRYCDESGKTDEASNPNGSLNNIAGICNSEGNVLGMMPHPERCSENELGSSDGRMVFDSIIHYLKHRK